MITKTITFVPVDQFKKALTEDEYWKMIHKLGQSEDHHFGCSNHVIIDDEEFLMELVNENYYKKVKQFIKLNNIKLIDLEDS